MITLLPQPNFLWWQHVYLSSCHSDRIIHKCYLYSSYYYKTRDPTICDLKCLEIIILLIFFFCFIFFSPAMAGREIYYFKILRQTHINKGAFEIRTLNVSCPLPVAERPQAGRFL